MMFMANWDVSSVFSDNRDHLLHPLYHPDDHAKPRVWVKGQGAVLTDAEGREYLV
jgi:adenosylmethionine-8-amino-7-oxononanoate aminotransferase